MEQCPVKATTIARVSRTDPILSDVIYFVQNSWPDYNVPEKLHSFHQKQYELSIHICLLWGTRIVMPEKLHKQVMQELHEGHLGTIKMKDLAREIF